MYTDVTSNKLKCVQVVIDRKLLKRIDKAAKAIGINRSLFIRAAAEAKLYDWTGKDG